MAEIVYDVDEGVAVKGVRLVTHLVRANAMDQDKVLSAAPNTACVVMRRSVTRAS